MKVASMKSIEQWVAATGRVIIRNGPDYILVTEGRPSPPMERPVFRRITAIVMEKEKRQAAYRKVINNG
jgi:hypothetical protein